MSKKYLSKWMNGTEALEHLSDAEGDIRKWFQSLQVAIRDGVIKGRWQGKERERSFWWNKGLSSDPDYASQVDDSWRNKFIVADSDCVDIDVFCTQSELLREDIITCFGDDKSVISSERGAVRAPKLHERKRRAVEEVIKKIGLDALNAMSQKARETEIKKGVGEEYHLEVSGRYVSDIFRKVFRPREEKFKERSLT
jgi:hypothetical protein